MAETNQSDSESAELCASYLKALADPTRLQVVRALQTGPLSVTDIALPLDIEHGGTIAGTIKRGEVQLK